MKEERLLNAVVVVLDDVVLVALVVLKEKRLKMTVLCFCKCFCVHVECKVCAVVVFDWRLILRERKECETRVKKGRCCWVGGVEVRCCLVDVRKIENGRIEGDGCWKVRDTYADVIESVDWDGVGRGR